MDVNFQSALRTFEPGQINELANSVNENIQYLGDTLLPSIQRPGYTATGGNIKIKGTMAQPIPMDTDYPEGGIIGITGVDADTAKFGQSIWFPEKTIREIQAFVEKMQLGLVSGDPAAFVQNALVNFLEQLIVKPHDDTREYCKIKAITEGKILMVGNKSTVDVDYSIPLSNIFANRTGNNRYNGTTSKFKDDMTAAKKILGQSLLGVVMHGDTLDAIIDNPVHNFVITAEAFSQDRKTRTVTVRTVVNNGQAFSLDTRTSFTLVGYSREGEILDIANPGQTIKKPFIDVGRIAVIGDTPRVDLLPQLDGTPIGSLGYYHVGPTVEGGGTLGRWSDIYVPEGRPWSIRARGAENSIPMFDKPEDVVLLSTALA
jgi:hypothetical protein